MDFKKIISTISEIDSTEPKQNLTESAVLKEKAKSKKQQRFMGMVHSAKKGEKPASKEVAKAAKDMSKKAAKDYAETKHKGLPEKKKSKKENFDELDDLPTVIESEDMQEAAKPDFLDLDGDGDTEEPMKKAAADAKKNNKDTNNKEGLTDKQKKLPAGLQKAIAKKKTESKCKSNKKTVKESVESKLSFREMMKLVVESGGQQQLDAKNPELFRWASRVAASKFQEQARQEVYAGLLYERFGGEFSLYDVLSEDSKD